MPDRGRGPVLPVYVAADESASMLPYTEDLNAGLAAFHAALLGEPMAASKVRLAVLGFSDEAVLRLPLTDLRDLVPDRFPWLQPSGQTCYGALFRTLAEQIPLDVAALKATGHLVHRPVLFFMTDGMPTDDWTDSYAALTDRRVTAAAPNIIACGIGAADASVVAAIASRPEFAFVTQDMDLSGAAREFFASLTRSVIVSGSRIGAGTPELVVERPEGFRLAIDEI
ncbi:hypothetical protein [Streptomyces sp. NPDC053367]|uniref:hypothetical protein n=1 Tax=Streptomyces sp. NPDC053367 TaxID=3365700 RepID=UPI0037D7F2CE